MFSTRNNAHRPTNLPDDAHPFVGDATRIDAGLPPFRDDSDRAPSVRSLPPRYVRMLTSPDSAI
jgi:hypothetical protein